jgi:tRNA dimethylallyltransferase
VSDKIKLIVVLGPTAVGKTALGIDLAQHFQGEIISGDSQQVYRHLSIGTAKASLEEQLAAKHHLIDVRDVNENYSAFDFVGEAESAIEDITSRGKLPIIVGGTGLYLQSLLEGYHLGGNVNHEEVLAYRSELEEFSNADLFKMVEDLDIEIPQLNRRRAIRALELAHFGKNLTNKETHYEFLLIGLNDDRQALYDRINKRVDSMIEQGVLDEARWLYDQHSQAQVSRAIGYKEFFPYFDHQMSLSDSVDKLKQNTRRFAKRQLTWFKNRMKVHFYMVGEPDFKEKIITDVTTFLEE